MLVEGYKRLRSEDAVPGSSTSYRITVRQLEALVRLSEALARLRCTDVILPQYVKEVLYSVNLPFFCLSIRNLHTLCLLSHVFSRISIVTVCCTT